MRFKYNFGFCLGWLSVFYGLFLILHAVQVGGFGQLNRLQRNLNAEYSEFFVEKIDDEESKKQVTYRIQDLRKMTQDSINLASAAVKYKIISGILFIFLGSYVARKSRDKLK